MHTYLSTYGLRDLRQAAESSNGLRRELREGLERTRSCNNTLVLTGVVVQRLRLHLVVQPCSLFHGPVHWDLVRWRLIGHVARQAEEEEEEKRPKLDSGYQ